MIFYIKYLSIIFCMTYSYSIFSNHVQTRKTRILSNIFCITLPILNAVAETYFLYTSIFLALFLSLFFFCILYKTHIEMIITTTIISYGVSYFTFNIATLIVTCLIVMFTPASNYSASNIWNHIAVLFMHITITYSIFRFKRIQNSISFIKNKMNNTPTMFISILLLLFALILTNNAKYSPLFIYLYFIAMIAALCFFISWHNGITRTYHDKRRDRDLDILNEHLDDLETDYQKMTEDKDELARIVHRDNKLVPAMLLSVETFLTEFPDATPQMKKRGDELMAELREAAEGRKGIILQQDKKCTAKPIETGISALDEVLKYMQEKAMAKNITLSASADLGIEDLVSKTIDETDLKTLTNDLLENAIIANSYNNGTNVYFIIGYFDKRLAIHVYDSGIPFTKEVLVDLGVTKHTTHEEDGGSGIGSMEIFKIARKYRASYIIDEYDTYAGPYTKRISIIFDKRNKYTLNTSRPQEEINYLRQRTDLNIEARKNRL